MQATAGGEERSEESNNTKTNTNTDADVNVDTNSNSDKNTNNKYNSAQATYEGPRKSSNAKFMKDVVVNEFANTSTDTYTDTF